MTTDSSLLDAARLVVTKEGAAVLAVRALLQVEAADGEEPSPDEREAGSSEDAHGATLRRARRWAKFLAGR